VPSPSENEDAVPPRAASSRFRLSVGAAVVLGLVVLSVTVGIGLLKGQLAPSQSIPLDGDAGSSEEVDGAELYVHVLGEVAHPGLYLLDDGARVAEALALAGGTLETADLRSVNLARTLSDGEQLIVAAQGATEATGAGGVGADGLIDLNNADAATLEELPRIGPALAGRIIDWREENGRFGSVDDLLAVPGIGEKMLAGLRDKVRV